MMAVAGFLSILPGKYELPVKEACRSFQVLCFGWCAGRPVAACAKRKVEKAGSPAHRGARGDLCVLIFAAERVRFCSEELHAARHKGRTGFGRLRWQYT